ncbi:MAG: peptide chain release factor N(5)-glutamine methyltransferase [Patescibacteria group bacterium]
MFDQKEFTILKAFVSKKTYEQIISEKNFKLNFWQNLLFKKLLKKRQKGIPLAYLLKNKDFFSLNFFVNKNVLIPRPDTEILVEKVLELISQYTKENNFLIDIGTGSACIPISILKNTDGIEKAFASDISKKALKIAKKNDRKYQTQINFLKGNLLLPFLKKKLDLKNINLFLTANLPYLTLEQFKNETSIQAEPKKALIAKENGLYLYKELFKQIKKIKAKNIFIFCEIDPTQTSEITKIIQNNFSNITINIKKDYSGLDRVVYFKI